MQREERGHWERHAALRQPLISSHGQVELPRELSRDAEGSTGSCRESRHPAQGHPDETCSFFIHTVLNSIMSGMLRHITIRNLKKEKDSSIFFLPQRLGAERVGVVEQL